MTIAGSRTIPRFADVDDARGDPTSDNAHARTGTAPRNTFSGDT
jgi:hypothetical protein